MVFGFTGCGTMMDGDGTWSTDVWLVRLLSRAATRSIADALTAIKEAAEESVDRMAGRGIKRDYLRLAFLGAGWSRNPANPRQTIEQLICLVSNFYSESGEILSHPNKNFNKVAWNPHLMPNEMYGYSVGEQQSKGELDWLQRQVFEGNEAP